jgi:hypothetical protein
MACEPGCCVMRASESWLGIFKHGCLLVLVES